MKTYEVTQTYWDITEDENSDNYYTVTVVVEANSPKEAERKACLEGLFDNEYEIPIENIGISDVYDVVEIEE